MLETHTSPSADITGILAQIVGSERVITDPADITLFGQDIYSSGEPPACIVSIKTTQELSQVVAAATSRGIAVLPRGAGMSYTGGYLAQEGGAVLVDLSTMNRILEINTEDMTVTVEAGVTWKQLYEALKEKGVRTPFWGPMSGFSSTIGGGLSQNNAVFGSGVYGPTADSVTSMTVVLADGTILKTGSASTQGGSPFWRHYGPDLTGVFIGDTGALGFKAEATFRLIKLPNAERWASFEFTSFEACAKACSAIGREGLACELFGFDPVLGMARMKRASLLADAKTFVNVVTGQKNLFKGVVEGAKMALAGRSFMADEGYSVHLVVEGRSEAAVEHDMGVLRAIALELGAKEIENTIPKVVRTMPFTPLNNILGPEGERWVPIHGILPHSKAIPAWRDVYALFDSLKPDMEALKVECGFMITTISTNGFLLEPVFYWPGERNSLVEATIEPHMLAKLPKGTNDDTASALVEKMRTAIKAIFLKHGGAHFQIGRTYPYAETREPAALALVEAIKQAVDPQRRVNPGSLGLK